jgi:hypothetical protein
LGPLDKCYVDPVRGKALLFGSLLVGAAVVASSDATASAPALSIVSTPTSQTVATKVISRLDTRTEKREPALLFGTATFTVTLANLGASELGAVSVADPASPSCDRTIGALAAGASVSYVCHAPNVGRDFINVLTASGSTQDGNLTAATTTAYVTVRKPHRRRSTIVFTPPVTG